MHQVQDPDDAQQDRADAGLRQRRPREPDGEGQVWRLDHLEPLKYLDHLDQVCLQADEDC